MSPRLRWLRVLTLVGSVSLLFFPRITTAQQTGQQPEDVPPGGAVSAPAIDPQPAAPAPAQDQRLLRELRRLAGGTPRQLAVALREAIRQRAWKEVDLFLANDRIGQLAPEDQLLVAQTVGPLMIGRAASSPLITEESRQALASLNNILNEAATDPAALDQAIRNLAMDDRSTRLAATRTLLRGGRPAVAKLAIAASQPNPPAPIDRVLEVLSGFGSEATEALSQLALYGTDPVRPYAQRSLLALDSTSALPVLAMVLHADGATETERAFAAQAFQQRLDRLPSAAEVESLLTKKLDSANSAYHLAAASQSPVVVWHIAPDRNSAEPIPTTLGIAAARRAADAAEMLRRSGVSQPTTVAKALGTDLRYRLLVDPAFGAPEDVEVIRSSWPSAAPNSDLLNRILTNALPDPMEADAPQMDAPLAIAVLRLMAGLGNPAPVSTSGHVPSPVVAAASHSVPRIRYEAASTIAALNPQHPYAGSAQALERWIEMSRLDDAPVALLLVNQDEWSIPIVRLLSSRGFRVDKVTSVADLVQRISQGGDLQLIVASSQPPDYAALEMIDRVRRQPLGTTVPMVLVGPPPSGFAQIGQRWSAPTLLATPDIAVGEDFPTPAAVVRALREQWLSLPSMDPLPPLSPAERHLFAATGLSSLAQLAEQPQSAQIYNLESASQSVVEAIARSGFSDANLRLLSSLGTLDGQDLLATLAMNATVSIDLRRKAADAFAHSIDRFGIQIPRSRIAEQITRYQSVDDPDSRQVIGRMLAAIEARAGVASAQ